jgi:hypothetical protein
MRESEKIFMCDRVFYVLTEIALGAAFGLIGAIVILYLGLHYLSNQ